MTATLPDTKYKRMLKTPVIARVGVFWWWEGQLLEDSVSLPDGDPSDDVINGRNDHVKVWPHFQKTYPSLSEKDYIAVPRGRVLYRCHERKFIVYLDRKIATPQVKAALIFNFNLPRKTTSFEFDPHYTTDLKTLARLFDDD